MTIDVLYFEGCPNWRQARENLRRALTLAGLPGNWDEIDLQASGTPETLRGFPSPSVLIDGKDVVSGANAASGKGSCLFGPLPSAEMIVQKLGVKKRRGRLP